MALKHLTTLIAAAALTAATVTATPVSAGSRDDLFKLAVGLGALAIIANEAKSDNRARAYTSQSRNWNHGYDRYGYDRRDQNFRREHRYEIPRTCLYKHWTRHGWETVVSRSCVAQYAKKHHIRFRDIRPCYRNDAGRTVWLRDDRDWIR